MDKHYTLNMTEEELRIVDQALRAYVKVQSANFELVNNTSAHHRARADLQRLIACTGQLISR